MPLSTPIANGPEVRGDEDASPIKDAAVLTCVAEPLPPDAFRPAFCDRTQKIYLARNLKRELLPAAGRPADSAEDRPIHPLHAAPVAQHRASSGSRSRWRTCRGTAARSAASSATRRCCSARTSRPQQKEPLLDNFVQVGIDYGGMIRAGHPGWQGFGGHGTGRKFPIVFAGTPPGRRGTRPHQQVFPQGLLSARTNRPPTATPGPAPRSSSPGTPRIDEATGIGRDYARGPQAWGPYEHTPPATWGPGQKTSEGYRRTSSTNGWVSEDLVLRLLHDEKTWDHDAFFDYVDRWMYEKDDAFIQKIKAATGENFDHDWAKQGFAWPDDNFVNEMWHEYRAAPGMPSTDGWTKQHDDSYYKNAIAKELKRPN